MGAAEFAAVLAIAIPIIVAIWVVRISLRPLERRFDRLSRIEGKLDAILKHSGVRFDPLDGIPEEALAAMRSGQKIEAIKRYRHATGADLREAKDVIEEALRRTAPQR